MSSHSSHRRHGLYTPSSTHSRAVERRRPEGAVTRAAIGALESRQHWSVSVSNGVLFAGGDDGVARNDEIVIVENATDFVIKVNTTTSTFNKQGISKLSVSGGRGDDVIRLESSVAVTHLAVVYGGDGYDVVLSWGGNDTIYGGTGSDVLYGGYGNDTFYSGLGDDEFRGGLGTDTVVYSVHALPYVSQQPGVRASIDGVRNDGYGSVLLYSGNSGSVGVDERDYIEMDVENVMGTAGNDTLSGNTANNVLSDGGGNDRLEGLAGNDTLNGGDSNDTLLGRDGHDLLEGENGNDTLDGGLGNDRLVGGANFDAVDYRSRFSNLVIKFDSLANDGQAGEYDNVVSDVEQVLAGSGNDLVSATPGPTRSSAARVTTRSGPGAAMTRSTAARGPTSSRATTATTSWTARTTTTRSTATPAGTTSSAAPATTTSTAGPTTTASTGRPATTSSAATSATTP